MLAFSYVIPSSSYNNVLYNGIFFIVNDNDSYSVNELIFGIRRYISYILSPVYYSITKCSSKPYIVVTVSKCM